MQKYITASAKTLQNPQERYPILTAGQTKAPSAISRPGVLVIETDADPETHEVMNGEVVGKHAEDMDAARFERALADAYDQVFEAVRAKQMEFITDLPGQIRRYAMKEAEARAYLDDPSPDLADYPRLSDEIGITAPTALELAQLWVAMADSWDAADRAAEKARMAAKTSLAEASTISDIDAAVTTLNIDLIAIQLPS